MALIANVGAIGACAPTAQAESTPKAQASESRSWLRDWGWFKSDDSNQADRPNPRKESGKVVSAMSAEHNYWSCDELEFEFKYENCDNQAQRTQEERLWTETGWIQPKLACSADERKSEADFPFLDPRCTYIPMQRYAAQDKDGWLGVVPGCGLNDRRLCFTRSAHAQVHKSIVEAAHCFGIDPKRILGKLVAESKLQINARSSTGAKGIGQITDVWSEHVKAAWNNEFKHLQKRSDSCQSLERLISQRLVNKRGLPKDCDLGAPPVGHRLSIALAAVHYSYSQRRFAVFLFNELGIDPNREVRKLQKEVDKLTQPSQIPAGLRRRLEDAIMRQLGPDLKSNKQLRTALHEMAVYAYNWGHSGIQSQVADFLDRQKQSSNRTGFALLERFGGKEGRFSQFLSSLPRPRDESASRWSEKLNYIYILKPDGPSGTANSVDREINELKQSLRDVDGNLELACTTPL